MKRRKPTKINDEGTLTVKVGPRNEKWSLQMMTDNFSTTEEWKRIKQSTYVVPNVELRNCKEFQPYDNIGDLEQKMRSKYQAKINQVWLLLLCISFPI